MRGYFSGWQIRRTRPDDFAAPTAETDHFEDGNYRIFNYSLTRFCVSRADQPCAP